MFAKHDLWISSQNTIKQKVYFCHLISGRAKKFTESTCLKLIILAQVARYKIIPVLKWTLIIIIIIIGLCMNKSWWMSVGYFLRYDYLTDIIQSEIWL